MKALIVSFFVGVLFALGLGVSGMTQPLKVQGFLDFLGDWDPSLALVMVGAIATHLIFHAVIKHRSSPLLGGSFNLPTKRELDWRLLVGASIFGAGWGLGGFCPGPALTSLGAMNQGAVIFVVSMLAGMGLFRFIDQVFLSKET